ncbi:DUF4439 domain-containing protein [Cellulomonas biazotea]|uniref:DUF4439 domain-containing protein n=2 Tax=Cellulomonas biazotea TaxID=1709 RepID=UPI0035E98655
MSAPTRPPADRTSADRTSPAGRPRRVAALAAGLVTLVVALAGCGVRLETPPPVEPSPDAVEQVRGRTVDDALALAADARALLDAGAAEPVAAVLADVVAFGEQHAQQLGGVYDSGLPDPTPSASPTATSVDPAPVEVGQVLADLATDAGRALDDADAVTDGPLARLVGSVGTARGELATRLAAALGVPAPEVVTSAGTAADEAGAADGGETTGADDAAADGTDGGSEDASGDPAGTATGAPTDAPPSGTAPAGLERTDLDALTVAHDEAGFALEVVAAKLTADQRALAQATAAEHRQEADRWARASGAAGTLADPRRAAYALPAGLDDPAVATGLVRTVETGVADTTANAVAAAEPGARAALLTALRDATVRARAWGAAPVAFPGMPELAAGPLPTAAEG